MAINFKINKELCERVGKNIKRVRLERGYTQVKVSKGLGLSGNKTISNWEAGITDITISQLFAVKDFLEIEDLEDLLR